jgi:putative membrane protein
MHRYVLAALALAALTSTAASGATPTAKVYVAKAGASDLFERQSGALMAKSTNASVRSFAAMMVKDHTVSTADVKAAAMKAKMKVAPPVLEPMQAKNLAALRASTGTARDKLYIDQQKAAHAEALTLQQGYAQGGDVPTLRAAATKIVPVVAHHKMMLDAM